MTIHWEALEEHFLMVPLFFRFIHFWGNNLFSELFARKPQSFRNSENEFIPPKMDESKY
jgi:hypothetical protein